MKDKSLNRLLAACLHLPLALLILTTLNPSLLAQSVPPFINYQGRLTDQAGRPSAGGSYTIQFRIWDSAINSATSDLIWGQQQEVTVQSNGVFNVLLGTTNATALSPTPTVSDLSSAFTGLNCFLGVTVVASNGVYVGQSEIAPRQQFLSVPYAVNGNPSGAIIAFGGNIAPPGWLLCDGSAVSRSAYPSLFLAIGTTWGSGDGSTTFQVPDLRGRVTMGAGQGTNLSPRTLGQTLGEEMHTLTINEMPSHDHGGVTGTDYPDHTHGFGGYGFGVNYGGDNSTENLGVPPNGFYTQTAGASTRHQHSIAPQGGGVAHNVIQPSAVVTYIIKY